MKFRFQLILFFVFQSIPIVAQIDSSYVQLLVNQSKELLVSNPDSARKTAFRLYEYTNQYIHDWGMAQSLLLIGATLHRQGQYDSAITYFDRSLQINEATQDTLQMGTANLNTAMCLVSTGAYKEGANRVIKAITLLEAVLDQDPKARHIYLRCFNIMGQVYYYQSDFVKTKEYFDRYLAEAIIAQDTVSIASAHNNLGAVYYEMKDYDQALVHDLKGAEIHLHTKNANGYANSIQNIAIGLMSVNKYEKSLEYLNKAKDLYDAIPNKKGVSEVYYNLGKLYSMMGNTLLSKSFYQKAITLSKSINNPDVIKLSMKGMSDHFLAQGNHLAALSWYKRYHQMSDSLVNIDNINHVNDLEVAYQSERKEQQIALLETDKELQAAVIDKNRISMIAMAAVIFVVFSMGIWLFKRSKYKQALQFESEKSQLKEEQIAAIITSQEHERKRFAMDLHDDFGQLLSAMRLNVNSMQDQASPETLKTSKKSEDLLDNMYTSLKNIAFDLMPHTLFEKGLEEALEELKTQINSTEQIKLRTQSFGIQGKLSSDQKVAIYRVIQELVSNIIKYAKATNINISITDLGDGLSLMIEDDGLGYDIDTFIKGTGNGWKNINSRLNMLRGVIDFDTQSGQPNSTTSIEVPYLASSTLSKAS